KADERRLRRRLRGSADVRTRASRASVRVCRDSDAVRVGPARRGGRVRCDGPRGAASSALDVDVAEPTVIVTHPHVHDAALSLALPTGSVLEPGAILTPRASFMAAFVPFRAGHRHD